MPRMLDVSDEVRTEIGDDEADRLLSGGNAPETYDCTSCRTPGSTHEDDTSTVLFVGEETAVLAFAHARCIPSQVVPVSEEQLLGAVQSITQPDNSAVGAPSAPATPQPDGAVGAPAPEAPPSTGPYAPSVPTPPASGTDQPQQTVPPTPSPIVPGQQSQPVEPGGEQPQPAVLGITCGLVLCGEVSYPALVVEPTGPVARPGSSGTQDEFLTLLRENGFPDIRDVNQPPAPLVGWSVLLAAGELHAVLQPTAQGPSTSAWWQAHQPLHVTDAWRLAAGRHNHVLLYAAPAQCIGQQPREDLLRTALEQTAAQRMLVGAAMPLAGT